MPSRLTFGVEFEFAFALLEEGRVDPEPELPQPVTLLPKSSNRTCYKMSDEIMNTVFELIATKMVAAGLPTRAVKREISPNSSHGSSSNGFSHVQDDGFGWIPSRLRRPGWITPLRWREQAVENANKNDDRGEPHSEVSTGSSQPWDEFGSQWMVTEDVSISPTRPGDYVWYPIEVQSPPYIFCEESLQAVRLACLHVHVGDGADGYTLQTMKKLMGFLWVFEPQIDQLHPNRRARLTDYEPPSWYESLRRGSILSGWRSVDGPYPLKVLEGLKIIFDAADIDDLDSLLRPDCKKSAYKISHLIYDDTIKRTVEFRQHEGSMHGTRAVEWIKTVVAIMEWIIDVETATLMDFLAQMADLEDRCFPDDEQQQQQQQKQQQQHSPYYDIIDLLTDIGLHDRAAYWDAAIPASARNKPTPYYARPRQPRRPSSSSAAATADMGSPLRARDDRERELDAAAGEEERSRDLQAPLF